MSSLVRPARPSPRAAGAPGTPARAHAAPLVISLPDGLSVSGVTMWAIRLAGGLARAGRSVTLVVHDEPPGQARLDIPLERGVAAIRLSGSGGAKPPSLRQAAGDLSPFIPAYRNLIRGIADRTGSPVVFCPTLLGDAFGIGAAISLTDPDLIRMVGWQHADIAYDSRVLEYYEPAIARFVGVSSHICAGLRARLPRREADICCIVNGVPAELEPPSTRPALRADGWKPGTTLKRPVRLTYTGRIEHNQKRVTALVALSDELARRGIDHSLTLVGDGPAAEELDGLIARGSSGVRSRRADRIRRTPPLSPEGVRALLESSDVFVLASRYEGLSVSMLEAMSAGCVPVVTPVASGATDVIKDGMNGFFAEVDPAEDDAAVAVSLAGAIERFLGSPASVIARAAWSTVRERFRLESHTLAVASVLDAAAVSPARPWPTDRPCAFTGGTDATGSGTVPPDGAVRLRELLASLAERSIILHGAGRHTVELAAVLAESPARIVAITDDDRARHGALLFGWPIIAPGAAATAGATDVVISSWIHADAIYARRAVYERQGLRVHHLYK